MQDFKDRLERGEIDVHHHHAEFKEDDSSAHSHSHDHSHSHSHAPYKHIAHPHGPRTMINDNICCCFMGQFPASVIEEEKRVKVEKAGTPSCKKN